MNILLTLLFAAPAPPGTAAPAPEETPVARRDIAPGPFEPTWESLKQYQCPDWFRDAKFGIWAVWSPQSVPEQGDWYARNMYRQGHAQYDYHVKTYGHPSEVGYKDIIHRWTAEKFDPDRLMALYKQAGAKYFCFMVNHHCNFDAWDSKYQPWNSVNLGPHKDLTRLFADAARKEGLPFGVTVHAARSWDWFAVAHGADKEGPKAGVPYDGALTKADGKGTWWEGYDPADLYGPHGAARTPEAHQAYVDKFFNRVKDLIDSYHPDLLYFDDGNLPLGEAGMNLAAHFYNANRQWHNGDLQAVLNIKRPPAGCRPAVVLDLERGIAEDLEELPWQIDTCIGVWHYRRGVTYKTVDTVIHMLADVVSKNGNMLLNIPPRGDGSLDDQEVAFLEELGKWMTLNGEAIYGTRPWASYGEGRVRIRGGHFGERSATGYTARDIRFTTKGKTLYALALGWPEDGTLVVRSLAKQQEGRASTVTEVGLLGYEGQLAWVQTDEGLKVTLPTEPPCEHAVVLKITGDGLRPAPVDSDWKIQQSRDGSFLLKAVEADLHGASPKYESGGGKDSIGYWADPKDYVSWQLNVTRPGTFAVAVRYSCAPGRDGSQFTVELGTQSLTGTSKPTGSWATYATETLGTLTLDQPGTYVLSVKPKAPPAWKVIGLQSVSLTPTD